MKCLTTPLLPTISCSGLPGLLGSAVASRCCSPHGDLGLSSPHLTAGGGRVRLCETGCLALVSLLSLGLARSLPVTSRCQQACMGRRCCLRSLNSVRECRISVQAWLLEAAAIVNTAIPPLPQPAILQQLLCIYLHDAAAVSFTPKAPFPRRAHKHPPSSGGTGMFLPRYRHPAGPSPAEQPCWCILRFHKGMWETKPQDHVPMQ